MNYKYFEIIEQDDLLYLDAGGIIGGTIGFLAGTALGTVASCYALVDSLSSGSTPEMAGKAMGTVFTGCVAGSTILGACATGLF